MSLVVIAETVRRHFVSVAFVGYAAIVAFIAFMLAWFEGPAGGWHSFAGLLILVAGAQLIGPEFSSGTLQLVLAKPINRSVYLLSRYAGVIAAIWIFLALGFAFELVGRVTRAKTSIPLQSMSVTTLNVALDALLICALLVFFGSFLRSYLNVVLFFVLRMFIGLTMAAINEIRPEMPGLMGIMARYFDRHPEIARVVAAIGRNLYPDRPITFDRTWLMLVLSNSAVALLLACLIFRRREVPYGAD